MGISIDMTVQCDMRPCEGPFTPKPTDAVFTGWRESDCIENARKAGWQFTTFDTYCPDCAAKQEKYSIFIMPEPDPADTALANGRWLYENWQKYLGQWVALDNGRLVAAGDAHLVFAMAEEWPNKCVVIQIQETAKG